MASLVYSKDKIGSLIFDQPFRHIKFIKLEMLDNTNFNKETFEITFSIPKTQVLIDFINWSNQIIIIVLEKDLITSNIVVSNQKDQTQTPNETKTPNENFAEKFNEKLGIFKNLFTKQPQEQPEEEQRRLKIENIQNLNENNLTWSIHKK
jgi:hypothetical protein